MGGDHFATSEAFTDSANEDVIRLGAMTGLGKHSRLLDWGCGAGRLAIGITDQFGRIDLYHGIDVQRWLIKWADLHLGRRDGFEFTYADLANDRYNPQGRTDSYIPADSDDYDVVYAYSVFSHLDGGAVAKYLMELFRVLKAGGMAFITAFVEDGVPQEEVNPVDYGSLTWTGPLHCVRFNKQHFEELVSNANLHVQHFAYATETDGQSLYVLQRIQQR